MSTTKTRQRTEAEEYEALDRYLTQIWRQEATPAEFTILAKSKIKTAAQMLKDAATNLRLSKIKANTLLAKKLDNLSRELATLTA